MIRDGQLTDIDQLIQIENSCFDSDRLSRRSFRHFLTKGRATLLISESNEIITGYILLLFHRGTSLARLYSIAVLKEHRKSGIAKELIKAAEDSALAHGCASLRLEVRVDNKPSMSLFESLGYRQFGRYLKYYEDNADALRLEKRLLISLPDSSTNVPYYQQTLDFTCGAASLMMTMNALNKDIALDRTLELKIWRESTTIFMTSGHGGCNPYGLAMSAHRRGFHVDLYVAGDETMFIDSVRTGEKKEVIHLVEQDFQKEIEDSPIKVHSHQLTMREMFTALDKGSIPMILISSWRMYKEKFPHWVVITGHDERFLYVHDPYIDEKKGKTVTDCINMPITLDEFSRMTRYGKNAQWASLIISKDH